MLTICHNAFCSGEKCAGKRRPLDGANGREILGTVSLSRFLDDLSPGSSRQKGGKFMQSYDNFLSFILRQKSGTFFDDVYPRDFGGTAQDRALCESCGAHEIFITSSQLPFIIIKILCLPATIQSTNNEIFSRHRWSN